jgi:pimeloyl-ACP methyl ester carboxylesterase
VFLLHGVPKTMSYWRHVVPLLTPHYTVIAVDNRGAGGSQRPPVGYDDIVHSAEQPGGTRAILEMYRARQTDAEQNRPH